MKRRDVICLLAAGGAPGQSGVGAPVMARWFDEEQRMVTTIYGLPGSLVMDAGEGTALPGERVVASSGREYLLYLEPEGRPELLTFAGARGRLPDLPPAPTSMVVSDSGRVAALGYGSEAIILTGLPEAPRIASRIPMTNGRLVAVRNDGRQVLAREQESLWLAGDRRVPLHDAPRALATFTNTGVAVADGDELRHWDAASGQWQVLGTRDEGLRRPVALAAYGDIVLVADAEARRIFEFRRGSVLSHACYVAPTRLSLLGSGRYLITGLADAAVLVFSARASESGVTTVVRAEAGL